MIKVKTMLPINNHMKITKLNYSFQEKLALATKENIHTLQIISYHLLESHQSKQKNHLPMLIYRYRI